MHIIFYYLSILIPFALLDSLWILVIAKGLYADKLGFLLSKSFNLVPAVFFYLLYALAILLLAVMPALSASSWKEALWRGAILGLGAYAAYDLTNHTTIAGWPTSITLIDMTWGVVATATASFIAYYIITTFF